MESHISDFRRWIETANDLELSQIVQAVITRYHVLFPDDEVVFLSLPTQNPAERDAVLRNALDLLAHK